MRTFSSLNIWAKSSERFLSSTYFIMIFSSSANNTNTICFSRDFSTSIRSFSSP
ncbi:GSCOCG00003097001-RA-CDS [Cotesia congregata]|nr:GSCOCG00003097001-RA-CDS [Cotesia congregata]